MFLLRLRAGEEHEGQLGVSTDTPRAGCFENLTCVGLEADAVHLEHEKNVCQRLGLVSRYVGILAGQAVVRRARQRGGNVREKAEHASHGLHHAPPADDVDGVGRGS